MVSGMRLRMLGTTELTWRDLAVFIRNSPHVRDAVHGAESIWGLQEHLLALVADLLNVANWQRAGDESAKRPDQIPRPGVNKHGGEQMTETAPVSMEEMDKLLGW